MSSDSIKIFFPCVHGVASGQLITINCFRVGELKSPIKVLSGSDEETAKRIIGASRYNEEDKRAAEGVMAVFSNPMFGGESYGLALAIADKLARYNKCSNWSEIYVTGRIPPDGCGTVEDVGEFEQKLDILLQYGQADSIFLFPEKNIGQHIARVTDKINQLEQNGITCKSVKQVGELEGFLWSSNEIIKPFQQSTSASNRISSWVPRGIPPGAFSSRFLLFLSALFIVILSIFLWRFTQQEDFPEAVPLPKTLPPASLSGKIAASPIPVNNLLESLQQRSTFAIRKIAEENKAEGKCEYHRKEFNKVLPLANTSAFFTYATYETPDVLLAGNAGIQLRQPISGPEGALVSLYKTTYSNKSLDGNLLTNLGWKPDDKTKYPYWPKVTNIELFLIIFQGTDFARYIVGADPNLLWGGSEIQQQWTLDVSKQLLEDVPDNKLVIFTGHGLGGGLATYAALSYNRAAITFNSTGLHPKNFQKAIHMGRGVALEDITTDQIENVYHFISLSQDGVVDFIGSTSFAGLSMLAGYKYLIRLPNIMFGESISLAKIAPLHVLTPLSQQLSKIHSLGGGNTIDCEDLHGKEIYIHPQ